MSGEEPVSPGGKTVAKIMREIAAAEEVLIGCPQDPSVRREAKLLRMVKNSRVAKATNGFALFDGDHGEFVVTVLSEEDLCRHSEKGNDPYVSSSTGSVYYAADYDPDEEAPRKSVRELLDLMFASTVGKLRTNSRKPIREKLH